MKRFLLILVIFLTGCSVDNYTGRDVYNFLESKKFDYNNFYAEFYDRNVSDKDKTKITLAIKDNDFYYSNSTFAYIKSDKFYCLDLNMNMYYEMDNFDDFDMVFHIFPSKLDGFEAYDHGFSKVFGKKYYYESYHIDRYNVSYFFKGNDIIYIKSEYADRSILFKFNLIKKEVSSSLFEIPKNFEFAEQFYLIFHLIMVE